jgi:hypothetical protein
MEIHLGLLAEILVCVFVCVLGIGICIGEDKKATPRTPPGTRPVQSLATLTPASTEIGLERLAIPLVTSDQSTQKVHIHISSHTYTDQSATLANRFQPRQTEQ